MKRNQDKISLWKRKQYWSHEQLKDYICQKLASSDVEKRVLEGNAFLHRFVNK